MNVMDAKFLCVLLLLFACIECRKSSGGGSRGSGGSWGSSSSSRGGGWSFGSSNNRGSSSSNRATNNWNKAKDRVSPPQHQQPKPQPKPNPDHHQLSYGQHEPQHSYKPSAPPMDKPKPLPNQDNAKLSYSPSAPPAPQANKPYAASAPPMDQVHKQTVTNHQSAPSAPPMPGANGANGQPPIGWNVGQQNQQQPPKNIGWNVGQNTGHSGSVANTASVANAGNARPIGFDNVNKQTANTQHNTAYGTQRNPPHATQTHATQNQNYQPGSGYQNGYNQNPGYQNPQHGYPNQQNYHSPNYNNQNPQYGYHPQGGGYNQGYHPNQYGYHPQGNYGGYGGYHPHGYSGNYYSGGGGYSPFGGYNPPGTNVHYGPVTYINGHSTPSYSYFHDRSDNSFLSFLVGFQVARMFSSVGSHSSYFGSHTYTVHHYHHDKQTVPEKVTVQANNIIACAPNVTLLCVENASPICMTNGTIMCVTSPILTVQCKENPNLRCVDSSFNCTNNPAPICNNNGTVNGTVLSPQNTTHLSVPCVSSVSIFGDLSNLSNVLNNTHNGTAGIAPQNLTMVSDGSAGNPSNGSVNGTANNTVNNIFCVTVIAIPQPVNLTAVNNLTSTASPLVNPEVEERGWQLVGQILDHIFAG